MEHLTDAELLVKCSALLSRMCDDVKETHERIASAYLERPHDNSAGPVLKYSMYPALFMLGELMNCIELTQSSDERSDLIFEELRRRFPEVSDEAVVECSER